LAGCLSTQGAVLLVRGYSPATDRAMIAVKKPTVTVRAAELLVVGYEPVVYLDLRRLVFLFGAWVSADAATDFTLFEILRPRRSLAALEATLFEVFSFRAIGISLFCLVLLLKPRVDYVVVFLAALAGGGVEQSRAREEAVTLQLGGRRNRDGTAALRARLCSVRRFWSSRLGGSLALPGTSAAGGRRYPLGGVAAGRARALAATASLQIRRRLRRHPSYRRALGRRRAVRSAAAWLRLGRLGLWQLVRR